MQKIIKTTDGSPTVYDDGFGESLHSEYGSITESKHIFIEKGLLQISKTKIKILEIGYGTGLNAVLSFKAAKQNHLNICYYGIEKFPPTAEIQTAFNAELPNEIQAIANQITDITWNVSNQITEFFKISKLRHDFLECIPDQEFDLIYFDPFSPEKHAEAWAESFLKRISNKHMKNGGVLITYSSKGIVKQRLRSAGLVVKRLAGPPGKRHILKATKA